ncbi:TMV resistance protein N isoform X2 [Cryptomeria japonica]|uniref:TMV resistance protein N isoform X2 n=1 Tax=Cryptomeria japonica TaxID=3369 RepID=UPI0027DA45A3|nr:TMV resistance protein N isoform X2 [Cryptomeria japonica]
MQCYFYKSIQCELQFSVSVEFHSPFMASPTSASKLNVEDDSIGEMFYRGEKIRSSASPKLYDVFINHRGPDVKETLALELYNSLEMAGIRTFLDCKEMELGDLFPSTIQNAIYSASVQIPIFSRRYAESVWCLAELALMLQTKRKIIPIFYDVPPSDLRYVEKGVYADSFNYHTEKRRYLDKLDSWKGALRCVSYISGCEFNPNNEEVEKTRSLEVARYPTGIEELVEDFERTCWQSMEDKDKVIGIYGMGGSGKTTLVKELFNQKRSEFSGSCFLFEVREAACNCKLTSLQTKLLKDLVQENREFDSVPDGWSYLRSRLASNPFVSFLIVIDDIDHMDQLSALLVTDLLVNNSRSLIIVTTRDERVLIKAGINSCYKMKEMNVHHSTELFCCHAFRQPYPARGYEDLVESFVKECGGLPLSLQVLGGLVFGSTDMHYWKLVLDKVRKTLPQDIMQTLKISFDSLDAEQKQVFMDVACFFVNKSRHMALRIWEASGWRAEHTLQILIDKCLVEVQVGRTYWNGFDSENIPLLRMHNHIQDLGREIAAELSNPGRLWRWHHLRSQEEKGFENILGGINGRSFRCLNSIFDQHTNLQFRCFLGNLNDCEGPTTALLWLELDLSMLEKLDEHENIEGEEIMSSMPSSLTIPSWIPLQSLHYLKISHGCLRSLWQSDQQVPLQLKELVLDGTNLQEFPNSLGVLSHLENLVLAGREEWNGTEWNNSMKIDGMFFSNSLRKLTNLRSLVLRDFTLSGELSFETSTEPRIVSLEKIDIRNVKLISKVSISGRYLVSIKSLHLEFLESLFQVDLRIAATQNYLKDRKLNTRVEEFPCSACLCCLERITIDGCSKLQKIKGIEELQGLKYLHLSAGTIAIWGCIQMWQKIPSGVTSCIWESNVDAESVLQQFNVLSSFVGRDGTVTEILSDSKTELVVPVTEQTSAIIIVSLVESVFKGKDCRKNLKIPLMDGMVAYIGRGIYIAAVVVTDEEKIIKMRYGISNWIPIVSDGTVRKGFIVTIEKTGEWKTLRLLQQLCPQEEKDLHREHIRLLQQLCPQEEKDLHREHMFEKAVTGSYLGKLSRFVIPQYQAEKYFPLDTNTKDRGVLLTFQDRAGKEWRFRYSYWRRKQSYVFTQGWKNFVLAIKPHPGDIVSFDRTVDAQNVERLYISCRRLSLIGRNHLNRRQLLLEKDSFLKAQHNGFLSPLCITDAMPMAATATELTEQKNACTPTDVAQPMSVDIGVED